MIDFGVLPPEVNSGRMWTDIIGSAPLAASGAAWQALATQLGSSAAAMSAIVAELSGSYLGPSSVALVTAAMPFVAWLEAHAAQAEGSALLAIHAAEVFETARAAHIPLPEVLDNRTQLAALVATNFMGVNSPAIAANEAAYAEYWAQDATAMYTYAGDAAAVTGGLAGSPFLPPAPTTDAAGLANQAAAVGESAGQSAGTAGSNVSSAVGQMGGMGSSLGGMASAPAQALGAIPQALGSMSSPLSSMMSPLSSMFGGGMSPMNGMFSGGFLGAMNGLGSGAGSLGSLGSFGGMNNFGGGMPSMMASMGRAESVGRLSVPAGWAGKAETMGNVRPLAGSGMGAAPMMSEQPETYGSGQPRVMAPTTMMGGQHGGTTGSAVYPDNMKGSLGKSGNKRPGSLPGASALPNWSHI